MDILHYHICGEKKEENIISVKTGFARSQLEQIFLIMFFWTVKELSHHEQFYPHKYQLNCLHLLHSKSEYSLHGLNQDEYGCFICRYASRGPRVENQNIIGSFFVSSVATGLYVTLCL